MANTVIGASVQIEFGSVGELRKTLQDATNRAKELKKQFGETSEEFKNAQDDVNKLKTSLDNLNLKSKLKEANLELVAMQDQFGATSQQAINAARKVADLKDRIEDARETADLFDPGKKFQAFVTLGSQIAAGFSAVQGAMALVGAESEDVQKALLKVQGAMALAQGLSQLKDFGKSWQQMKIFINSATQGLNGFKKALISSGIGLLVVSVGLLVAYWEDIKRLVTGVSKEQEKLVADSQAKASAAERELDVLERSGETLKASGKTEKEITQLKLNQLATIISSNEQQLAGIKANKEATIAQAERYNKIIKAAARVGMEVTTAALRAIAVPLQITIDAVNLVSDTLGFGKVAAIDLQSEITKMNEFAATSVANLIIDPKELRAETDKAEQDLEDKIINAKEKQANLNKSLVADNKKTNDKISAQDKQAATDRLEAEKILAEARKKLMSDQDAELFDLEQKRIDDINKLAKAGYVEGTKERALIDESYENQRIEIISKYQKERKEKEKEFLNEINKINEDIRIAGIKDLREKEKAELQITHREQLTQMAANENLTFLQRLTLTVALKKKQKQEEDALQQRFDQEDLQKKATNLLTDASVETASFSSRLKLIQDRKALENQIIFASEEERAKFIKENEEATTAVLADQYNARVQLAKSVGDALSSLTDIVGKETAAGKALAIAQATINTFLGITEVWKSKAVLPEPFNTATKIAATITTAAGGFAAVRNIAKTKVPGGGGPGPAPAPPPPSTLAPLTPALSPAVQGQMLNSDAINNLGNTAIRAFVMNSDIQNNDQRNAYLQRNARIG